MSAAETVARGLPPRDDPVPDGAEGLILEGRNLAKSFGATRALRDFSFRLQHGEILTIQGENGSGKSTLVKTLAGVHRADRGVIRIGGHDLPYFASPRQALQHGLGTVFQEVLVAGSRSVLENVWLGADGVFKVNVPPDERRARAHLVLTDLLGEVPDLETPVERLSLSQRQACCIARVLLRDPEVVVLDEATSALDIATRDRLFALLRRRVATGKGVLFISHRMDEVAEISDRVTVMRMGETVGTLRRAEATPARLVQLMTGSDTSVHVERRKAVDLSQSAVVLNATGIRLRPEGAPMNLSVRAGEMIGLAGLEGQGQQMLLRVLWGGGSFGGSVTMTGAEGQAAAIHSPADATRHGIAYVPRERKTEALFAPLSILDNFALPTIADDRRAGLIRPALTRHRFEVLAKRLGIRYHDAAAPVSTLSGGNQQKVVMVRWLAASPRVLLLNDPTRGVDAHTKQDLYTLLQSLTSGGVAVVMISSEVDEHLALMDRVLVLRDQEVFRELSHAELSRSAIVAAYFGKTEET